MKIGIVSQYYKPEEAKIPNGLAQELVRRGHSVRVVTGYPNYPGGRIFPGFKQRLVMREMDGKVAVRRVPLFISHSDNAMGRIANYLSFGFSVLTAPPFLRSADVIYVYATQMTAAIAPQIWNGFSRQPYVLHVQDLWPESITGSQMVKSSIQRRLVDAMLNPWLRAAYRKAAALIAIAPTMGGLLNQRGAEKSKTFTVLNWADEDALDSPAGIDAEERELGGVTVVYAGSFGHLQDLQTAIAAARLVSDLPDFRLVLVGAGIAEQDLRRAAEGLHNVEFRSRVPISKMGGIYQLSDFQLVMLRNLPIFHGTVPSKLQGSLAAGVPVISTVPGDTADLVTNGRVGIVARPEDADSLAVAFREAHSMSPQLRQEMAQRANKFYQETMSMRVGVDRIEEILRDAATVNLKKRKHDNKL